MISEMGNSELEAREERTGLVYKINTLDRSNFLGRTVASR